MTDEVTQPFQTNQVLCHTILFYKGIFYRRVRDMFGSELKHKYHAPSMGHPPGSLVPFGAQTHLHPSPACSS